MTATITPRRRTARTFIQAGIGVCVGIPAAVAGLGLPADVTVKVAAVTGTIAALASLVQNEWDKARSEP